MAEMQNGAQMARHAGQSEKSIAYATAISVIIGCPYLIETVEQARALPKARSEVLFIPASRSCLPPTHRSARNSSSRSKSSSIQGRYNSLVRCLLSTVMLKTDSQVGPACIQVKSETTPSSRLARS